MQYFEETCDIKISRRGRGKYTPKQNISIEEVQQVLSQKIEEEMAKVPIHLDESHLEHLHYRQNQFNVVSLFSGCGGLDLGFELAGIEVMLGKEASQLAFESREAYEAYREQGIFHTVYTNDLFKEANETYRNNFSPSIFQHEIDIRKIRNFPKADLILGGFPCPGFSEAGPRLIDDERNFLYIHFVRAVMQAQPYFFVAENVKGLLTIGKGKVIEQIAEDFNAAGYHVQFKLLNARDYGVPQLRERVFIIGVRKDLQFKYQFPAPSHGEGRIPFVTLRDAIGDLEHDPGKYFKGSYSSMYLSRNRKKQWHEQSFTIQASGRQAPLHPSGVPMKKISSDKWIFPDGADHHRRLSVKEIARIQTFPDWFQFSDGGNYHASENSRLDKQYKQIGNAVPVLLAKAVAMPIALIFKKMQQENKATNTNVQQLTLF